MSIFEIKRLSEVQVDESLPVFCDSETKGLYKDLRILQLMQKGWDKVVLVIDPNIYEVVQFLNRHHTVWHNSHYDITCVQQQTSTRFIPERFDDTFLAARLALPTLESYSLDGVLEAVVGFDVYGHYNLDKTALQKSDWSKPMLSQEQLLYAALDVYHMPEVWDAVQGVVEDINYVLDMSTVRNCLGFQWNGMPLDRNRLDSEWRDTKRKLAEVTKLLPPGFNPKSWQQVRKWLGVDQSDDLFLATLELHEGNEKAKLVRQARKLRKKIEFFEKYDAVEGNVIYGKFKPSARSGRLTSDDMNQQQHPRALKCVFGVDESEVLIYSDYAQIELRTICAILGIELMTDLFRRGEDVHAYVAKLLFGEDWTKDDRQITKTYNFNLLYGGSVNMVLSILLKYDFVISPVLANKHKAKWLNLWGEINQWQQRCIARWRRGEINQTPLGRKYKAKLMTDFMNILNQGAGAEVNKLAMHYLMPRLREFNEANDCSYVVCNNIHDSYILRGPNNPELYKQVAQILAEAMQEAWFEMSKLYKVKDLPMPVDVAVGHNWGDIEGNVPNLFEMSLDPYHMLEKVNAAV